METEGSKCHSRRKGGAGRGFKAKNVVPTLYQRRTNVVPTLKKRRSDVLKTFLKRRYDVFPRRETSLSRCAKNEIIIFGVLRGEAAYAKDASSRFGRFASHRAPAIPFPRPRGPRFPEQNIEIAGERKTKKCGMRLEKTTEDTTKKTTKRDEANRDANKQKPKSNIENRKNGKRRQKTKSFREQKKTKSRRFLQMRQRNISGDSERRIQMRSSRLRKVTWTPLS